MGLNYLKVFVEEELELNLAEDLRLSTYLGGNLPIGTHADSGIVSWNIHRRYQSVATAIDNVTPTIKLETSRAGEAGAPVGIGDLEKSFTADSKVQRVTSRNQSPLGVGFRNIVHPSAARFYVCAINIAFLKAGSVDVGNVVGAVL